MFYNHKQSYTSINTMKIADNKHNLNMSEESKSGIWTIILVVGLIFGFVLLLVFLSCKIYRNFGKEENMK